MSWARRLFANELDGQDTEEEKQVPVDESNTTAESLTENDFVPVEKETDDRSGESPLIEEAGVPLGGADADFRNLVRADFETLVQSLVAALLPGELAKLGYTKPRQQPPRTAKHKRTGKKYR